MGYNPIIINQRELLALNSGSQPSLESMKKSGGYFYSYTRYETAKKILGQSDELGCFYVSNLESMNDPNETLRHQEERRKVYALCFSNNREESIPMWFLYGGITGEGVRIGFTADKLYKLIEGIETVSGIDEKHRIIEGKQYTRGQDFELHCGWVYYWQRADRIRYRDEFYSIASDIEKTAGADRTIDERRSLTDFCKGNYFVKDYAWYYEKEFRIVFVFKESVGEQIALHFDKKNLMPGMHVTLAPNVLSDTERTKPERQAIIKNYEKELKMQGRVKPSQCNVKFNLLGRNSNAIASHINAALKAYTSDHKGTG